MKESVIEHKIGVHAKARGCLYQKYTGAKDWPDRMLISITGAVAFMEIKKPGGEVRPRQLRICAMLNARNVPSCIVDNIESGRVFIDNWLATQACPALLGESTEEVLFPDIDTIDHSFYEECE